MNNKITEKNLKENNTLEMLGDCLEALDLPREILDLIEVFKMGDKKHGYKSWLDPSNPSLQHKSNHASMSRHTAEHYCGVEADEESGLDPLLHLATRALMKYSRKKRNLDI